MEPGQEREVKLLEGRNICLCDGGGVDSSGGCVGIDASGEGGVFRSGGGGLFEFDIFELGKGFVGVVVEVEVENFELGVGCVVRLVLWCLNGRGDFL